MPRILALDLDGTLLDSRSELRTAVVAAVREASREVHVVICTGRRYRSARRYVEALGLEGPMVTQNGTMVRDARTGATLVRRSLAKETAARARALMRDLCPPLMFVDGYHDGLDIVSEPMERLHPVQQVYLESALAYTRFVDSLDHDVDEEVLMLSCMAERSDCVATREQLEARLGPDVATHLVAHKSYPGHIVEAVSPESGKWNALAAIARELEVDAADIVAIGDDHNDAEMLEKAGVGVAMGNAMPGVKERASHVTASNDEDGAAHAIRRFVLS